MKIDIDIQYIFHHLKWGLIKMIFILNRNLKIKIDKNDFTSMSFSND